MDLTDRRFPLSSAAKKHILSKIFGCETKPDGTLSDSYFSYYEDVVENSPASSLTDSHQSIADTVALIRSAKTTKTAVEDYLRKRLPKDEVEDSDDLIGDAIRLATRLLIMMPIEGLNTRGLTMRVSGETKIRWEVGPIARVINSYISPGVFGFGQLKREPVKLGRIFNARILERIASVKIRWTSNLADHLRMRDEDTVVEIFHNASFLKLHQHCQTQEQVLPSEFLDETLKTLALLMPEHDKDTEKWFKKHQAKVQKQGKLPLDPLVRECGQLKAEQRNIESFNYWQERLAILKQVFDEAEPKNIKQWWHDRRKLVQWSTFWVAALVLILTIVFGLIQCIEGGLQVWLAYKALPSQNIGGNDA
ncbi:hypothetical protein G7Y89_g6763 [Cudoniella acicularis]|uniref:Uncharacterized protein n=1 Tax=Cudoniella acicularis TaxID=354080 RepID=A0A8H4RJT6_9HELO|nr:hypothetical protein G7Y89_g6763 [Cudoniella acicularis]